MTTLAEGPSVMTTVDGREQSGSIIVTVRGANLDAAAALLLRSVATRGLERGSTLIVDLSAVEFADSSGLGVLSALLRDSGWVAVALVGVGPQLCQILARVPKTRLPAIYGGVDEALIARGSHEAPAAFPLTFPRARNDILLTSDYASHA